MMLNQLLSLLLCGLMLAASATATSRPSSSTQTKTTSDTTTTESSTTTTGSSTTRTSASPYLPSATHLLVVADPSHYSIAASVISYNSTATTYALTAPNSVYSPSAQLTVGPSTWRYYQVGEDGTVYDSQCSLAGTTSFSCFLSIDAPGNGPQIQKTTATNSAEFSSLLSIASVTIVTALPTGSKWTATAQAARPKSPEKTAGAVVAAAMLVGQMMI